MECKHLFRRFTGFFILLGYKTLLCNGDVVMSGAYSTNSLTGDTFICPGSTVTLTCSYTLTGGDSFGQLVVREYSDTGSDGTVVYQANTDLALETPGLQNDLDRTGVSSTVNAGGDTVTIVIDSYASTDGPNYNCKGSDNLVNPGVDAVIDLPRELSNEPTVSITSACSSGATLQEDETYQLSVTSPDSEGESPYITISYTGESSSTECNSANTCTRDFTAGTYDVTVTAAICHVQATETCTLEIKKEEKNKEDKCGPISKCWWKILLLILGILAGAGGIITIILFKMKKGCFAQRGASSTAGSRKYQKKDNDKSQEEKNKKSDIDIEQANDKDANKDQKDENDKSKEEKNKKSDKGIEPSKDTQAHEDQKDQKDMSNEKTKKNMKSNEEIEQSKEQSDDEQAQPYEKLNL